MSDTKLPKVPRGISVLIFSFIVGQLIWDKPGYFHVAAMLATGVVCGAIAPHRIWFSWLGMYGGVLVRALLSGPIGPLAPLGLCCFMPVFCLTTVAGGALAAVVRATVTAIRLKQASQHDHF
jgi:hypothetical protein